MSQLDLLRYAWNGCSDDEREQFMQLLIQDQFGSYIQEEPPEPVEELEEEPPEPVEELEEEPPEPVEELEEEPPEPVEELEEEPPEPVEELEEEPPEQCALCLLDIADDTVKPYECVHEFCCTCYDTNKGHACMKTCPMCRAVLLRPLVSEETGITIALKKYIIIWNRYISARAKRICVITDILFDDVDLLPQFYQISTAPINFMTRSGGITVPDGGTQWESGIYTLTTIVGEGENRIYIQRYMFVNRRSNTYIKYCVLFETIDLVFKGRHLKDMAYANGGNSEYFSGITPSSTKFIRRNWKKMCDINISIMSDEYEQFLEVPRTTQSNIDFQLGYNELENYFRDVLGTQLHSMIALYISIAHDLLIYEANRRFNNRIPYTFLCFIKYDPLSHEERIFLKPPEIENTYP